MPSRKPASALAVWSALGTVYLVWGSTYLAIAVVVASMPPLLSAGARFLAAGVLLTAWLAIRGVELRVTRRQLAGASVVGVLLLCVANGLVMVAERTVPSGVAALIVSSIPLVIVVYRRLAGERVGSDVLAAVLVGLGGVAVLVIPGGLNGTIDPIGAGMLLLAAMAWGLGTFMSPRLALPRNALVSTAYQMVAAGVALLIAGAAIGELARLDPAAFSVRSLVALAYLVIFGSLVAFTAYTWVLQHAPVSLVSTYAFVNPVVAVALGALILAEPITPTMLGGAAIIVVAVAFIVLRSSEAQTRSRAPEAQAAD